MAGKKKYQHFNTQQGAHTTPISCSMGRGKKSGLLVKKHKNIILSYRTQLNAKGKTVGRCRSISNSSTWEQAICSFPRADKNAQTLTAETRQMSIIYTVPYIPHPLRAISTETDPGKAHKCTPRPCPIKAGLLNFGDHLCSSQSIAEVAGFELAKHVLCWCLLGTGIFSSPHRRAVMLTDGSTSPTSTKSALFLFAEFYCPAQINSDDDLHKVSQQLSSTQLLGQAASAAFIHWLISSISNEGAFKRLQCIIALASYHQQQR